MIRRAALSLLTAALLLGVLPSTASAGEFITRAKWKNCDNAKASILITATFRAPARYYGNGKYMVKKQIKWQKYDAGRWLERDHHDTKTEWLKITNQNYDFVTSIGDKTSWGYIYGANWRAQITFKLLKNRKGPIDKKVDEIKIYPKKGSFREQGSNCGVDF